MSKYSLISYKTALAELFTDFNIQGSDWIGKAQRHIARAIELMQLDGYFELKFSFGEVEDGRLALPCDNKYLIGVFIQDRDKVFRLPLKNDTNLGHQLKGMTYHQYNKGYINHNYLNTNYEYGKVCFVYFGIPKDECGDLLIPDNAFVFEAIPYYVIFRLSMSGYKHPVLSWDVAKQLWEQTYPRARNVVNFPSIEEMQHFTEVNTNPLYINRLETIEAIEGIPNLFDRTKDTVPVDPNVPSTGNSNTYNINNVTNNYFETEVTVDIGIGTFSLRKNPNNDNPDKIKELEVGDFAFDGSPEQGVYWKAAMYKGGLPATDPANWIAFDPIEDIE